MTPEQITAIAREYAEEMAKGSPSEELSNCLKNSMLTMNTEYVAEIFRWLLLRYCLVEKAKVIEKFKITERRIQSGSSSIRERGILEKERLKSLFPEIAKEVEE